MKGNAKVIKILNDALCAELTAINQYVIHQKMRENWGYMKLAKNAQMESIDEMKHADGLIDRILFLDGVPNMQKYGMVEVGTTVPEQLEFELKAELGAIKLYNKGIKISREVGDNGSAEKFEALLVDEEGHVDWIEAQQHLIDEIGLERYLAQQMGDSE